MDKRRLNERCSVKNNLSAFAISTILSHRSKSPFYLYIYIYLIDCHTRLYAEKYDHRNEIALHILVKLLRMIKIPPHGS